MLITARAVSPLLLPLLSPLLSPLLLSLPRPRRVPVCSCDIQKVVKAAVAGELVERTATLRFRQDGAPEEVVPTVALTRSRDQTTGTATFRFERPSALSLNSVWEDGLITGLFVCDLEGCLSTRDLKLDFQQGRPQSLTAVLVLKSTEEWQRFLQFMRVYAREHDMSFESAEPEGVS